MAKEKSSSLLLALKKKGSDTLDDIYCTLSHNFVEVFVVVSAAKSKKKKFYLEKRCEKYHQGIFLATWVATSCKRNCFGEQCSNRNGFQLSCWVSSYSSGVTSATHLLFLKLFQERFTVKFLIIHIFRVEVKEWFVHVAV